MLTVTTIEKLDRVIHEPGRLKIMTVLAGAESLSFKEIKQQLGMTDGNLCVHMRTLEESGYVSVSKSFVDRKPLTQYALTPAGREAFQLYLQTLAEIVKQSQPAEQPHAAGARPVLQGEMVPAK